MRICSLLPSATEIAFALGLGHEIVGVSHECDHPPQAKEKPVVVRSIVDARETASREIDRIIGESLRKNKSLYVLDLERLREADPDVILTQELCDVCAVDYEAVLEAAQSLSRKPKVIPLNPALLSDVLRDIEHVGEATGRKNEAKALVGHLRERLERVSEKALTSRLRPRVACLEWLDPIYSAGHWVPEMVELAGGSHGLGEKGAASTKIAWEKVAEFAPEIIVLMPCGFDIERTMQEIHKLWSLPGWDDLPATRQRNVFVVNGSAYFNRPGPRLVEGFEILAQIIHPEIFPWEAPPGAARRLG